MEIKQEFIFGAQYYRAPTPDSAVWEQDLKNMRAMGLNMARFWIQWRWAHRDENEFYFEDIDRLMDLAAENGLNVTLGLICDVAPKWLYDRHPDCVMVTADGKRVEPDSFICRQIGGFPGPCLNHEAAKAAHGEFIRAVVARYRSHPALSMWDVWCEPEQCGRYRTPKADTLVCYCDTCRKKFLGWLERKYHTIDRLNSVWGKCYRGFWDVEVPRATEVYGDFLDYREFMLDQMTEEADWRLDLVRAGDGEHPVYLHVVPNTAGIFNAVTCVDDFRLAEHCDLFGSTNFSGPIWSVATRSAGWNKRCINAECHIGGGSTASHQKPVSYEDMLKDLVPQLAMGIRGVLFWQYRAETLGKEAPAWGMTKPDGTPGSVALAAQRYIRALAPYEAELMSAEPPGAEVAVWKGRTNELFTFAMQHTCTPLAESIERYVNTLYEHNYNCRIVDDRAVENGLPDAKLLIVPFCYALSGELADALDRYVRSGGVLLCEAHLGGYDADAGRHSTTMPGCGLSERWGIVETETTSSYHLKTIGTKNAPAGSGDAEKAAAVYGLAGGKYFSVPYKETTLFCAERFAALKAENSETICAYQGTPILIRKKIGAGTVYYCGSNLGQGAAAGAEGFSRLLCDVLQDADVRPNLPDTACGLHTTLLGERLLAVDNQSNAPRKLSVSGRYRSVFHEDVKFENEITLPASQADLFVRIAPSADK